MAFYAAEPCQRQRRDKCEREPADGQRRRTFGRMVSGHQHAKDRSHHGLGGDQAPGGGQNRRALKCNRAQQ